MALDDDITLVKRVPTLALLGDEALRILAIGAEAQVVSNGSVLFYAGEPGNSGYVIQEGAMRLLPGTQRDGDSERTLGPGALIGELTLITGNARPATAIALEETVVIRVPRTLFLKVLEGYPDAARALRDVIAQRVEQCTNDLAPVRARLALGLDDQSA
ncbi:MAG: cyclic nucleotide-binding domain-containing protein [Pseudolabrys sp.]